MAGAVKPALTAAETPERGLVTWASEGTEGGPFHSRRLHVPSDSSGLTIGRGYDMKFKSSGLILGDLSAVGVPLADATILCGASGLLGESARAFISSNKLESFEISRLAQKLLFDISYKAECAEAKRLCTKEDVVAAYGACNWDQLHPAIVDMLIDLKFRGDYDGTARTRIQKFVVANDLVGFAKAMSDSSNWRNVPKDRFSRRIAFLASAVQVKKKADDAAAAKAKLEVKSKNPQTGKPTLPLRRP